MRAVLQRVLEASVWITGKEVGRIEGGILVFLGVGKADKPEDARYLAEKVVHLRMFADVNDKMNLSVVDVGGGILVVSQFTLWGDCRKGRRPSYINAAPPDEAHRLYQIFVDQLRRFSVPVETGEFKEMMQVHLVNDGPVTLLLDTEKTF
jgi:D-aminoacyl-tRNA deacylase